MTMKPIRRHSIIDVLEAPICEWVRAADVDAAFPPGVAYIPVPRCERCAHWKPFAEDLQPARIGGIVDHLKAQGLWPAELTPAVMGDCMMSTDDGSKMSSESESRGVPVETHHDFGCVMFKEKT